MNKLFEEEDNHYLSIDELCSPKILFYGAKYKSCFVGCGGLLTEKNYGELKSIFTDPDYRRIGVAKSLIRRIEEDALKKNTKKIRLETGKILKPALSLYLSLGYRESIPFGNYETSDASIFLEKSLVA